MAKWDKKEQKFDQRTLDILAKTKCITNVLSCMERLRQKGPLLDASLSEFKEV